MPNRTGSQEVPWGSGLANRSKQFRAVQLSRKRHWDQLVAMLDIRSSGSEGSQVSTREDQERQFEARCFHLVVRFHTSWLSWTVPLFHTSIS